MVNVSGAGISVELLDVDDTLNDNFRIKNTTFKDCVGNDNNIWVVYLKGD
jgi:hypothetical protein